MTKKEINTDLSTQTRKASLTERIRQITSAALMASGLLLGGSAHASVPRQSSVVDRALAVQQALKAKVQTGDLAQAQTPRAQTLLAQWRNGERHHEWGNWDNWHNWHNWGNWHNWSNWGNAFWPR